MAGVLAIVINSVVVWPWLGRVLRPADFSALVQVLALSSVVAPVLTGGLHAYVLRSLAQTSADEGQVLKTAVRVSALLFTIVGCLTGLYWWAGASLSAILWLPSAALALLASAALRGLDLPVRFAGHALATQCLTLATIPVLISWGLRASSAIAIAGAGIAAVSMVLVLSTGRSFGFVAVRIDWRRALSFSIPLIPHLMLAAGFVQFSRLVLASGAEADVVLTYQFATLLAGGGLTVIQAVTAHLSTDALRVPMDDFGGVLRDMWQRLSYGCLGLTAGLTVFLATVLPIWLPSAASADQVAGCVGILLPALLAQSYGDTVQAFLMRQARTELVTIATLCGAVSMFGLLCASYVLPFTLSPELGAVSVTVGVIVRALMLHVLARALESMPSIWDAAPVLTLIFPCLASGALVLITTGS